MGIIDFHTHAFPDLVAKKAITLIEGRAKVKAKLDGKISSLLKSMDETGIEKSVICSIATRVEQFSPILKWAKRVSSERIIPFPSFHPSDSEAIEKIEIIKKEGFKGIKLHPYYQNFIIDEERMFPVYEKIEEEGLILVSHTGFDFAYPRIRKADSKRIINVLKKIPGLKLVTTHFGGWQDWDEVKKYLIGKPVYMEISFIHQMGKERAREFLLSHPKEYILFGTDSPWNSQKETLEFLTSLGVGKEIERYILYENAKRILKL